MITVVNADLAMANGSVHVVWQDNATGTVKYRKGTLTPFVHSNESNPLAAFEIYPNPSTGIVNLVIPKMDAETKVKLLVLDIQGRRILEMDLGAFQGKLQLATEAWETGVYFIQIKTSGQVASKKLVLLPKAD